MAPTARAAPEHGAGLDSGAEEQQQEAQLVEHPQRGRRGPTVGEDPRLHGRGHRAEERRPQKESAGDLPDHAWLADGDEERADHVSHHHQEGQG
jgi:hypothetical protein